MLCSRKVTKELHRQDVTALAEQRARLRFYCQTLKPSNEKSWSWFGWQYIQALIDAEVPFRLISSTGLDLTVESTQWFSLRELFQTPLPNVLRLNIVCGPPGDLNNYYTDGMINVGITAPKPQQPNDPELESMIKYDRIIAPSWDILNSFDPRVIHRCKLYCVRPHPRSLIEMVEECLQQQD
jgi:hypothetical protein